MYILYLCVPCPCRGWTRLNPDQLEDPHTLPPPQDPPNQLPQEEEGFVLHLVLCDPSPITQPPQQETAEPPPNQASSLQEPAHQVPARQPPQQGQQPCKGQKQLKVCLVYS